MDSNWAAEHLQVIRTLMERSALYRRALAPIMIYSGVLGLLAGALGQAVGITAAGAFVGDWAAVAAFGLAGSFLLVRRQALKDAEAFWSPPTRRVAHALLPAFFVGAVSALAALAIPGWDFLPPRSLPAFWMLLYGCALTSAGFFMQRGIKLLGWLFILCGCALMAVGGQSSASLALAHGHWLMGGAFGGLQLAYGIYLYFTEQRGKTA